MGTRNKTIHVRVDPNFFDKFIEKPRRRESKRIGVNLSQGQITKLLANSNFKLPKLNLRGLSNGTINKKQKRRRN